jgi:hypothetical protein
MKTNEVLHCGLRLVKTNEVLHCGLRLVKTNEVLHSGLRLMKTNEVLHLLYWTNNKRHCEPMKCVSVTCCMNTSKMRAIFVFIPHY